MRALVDFDILRYEIGFAAETGWKAVTDSDRLPPWDYVADMLHMRLESILVLTESDSYVGYLTDGPTFREEIATTKPYKGNRKSAKPWHFNNLTVYMRDVLNTKMVRRIEADDAMAIDHLQDPSTIICSRDKDLRQVPGWFYSWELGQQPSFGPTQIDTIGTLEWDESSNQLKGTGFSFFCAQMLMGDPVDNIPGLPKWGPKKAYAHLAYEQTCGNYEAAVLEAYTQVYGHEAEQHMLEQGRLLWMTRKLHEDGSPVLWEIGMYE